MICPSLGPSAHAMGRLKVAEVLLSCEIPAPPSSDLATGLLRSRASRLSDGGVDVYSIQEALVAVAANVSGTSAANRNQALPRNEVCGALSASSSRISETERVDGGDQFHAPGRSSPIRC
jgi:hypothetical protein